MDTWNMMGWGATVWHNHNHTSQSQAHALSKSQTGTVHRAQSISTKQKALKAPSTKHNTQSTQHKAQRAKHKAHSQKHRAHAQSTEHRAQSTCTNKSVWLAGVHPAHPSPSKPLALWCQSWLSHCLSPRSESGNLFLIVIVWSQIMHNYHSSTGMELYLLIDRNDYVINIPVKLHMKISRTCKFVAQILDTWNFRYSSTNFRASLKFQNVCTEHAWIHVPNISDPLYLFADFAWFCIFLCFLHSKFCAFCKWSLPGHPYTQVIFFVHIFGFFALQFLCVL